MSKIVGTSQELASVAMCVRRVGDKFTAYKFAKENNVSPKTALKMLRRMADHEYLIMEKNNHRPNAYKYYFRWTVVGAEMARMANGYATVHELILTQRIWRKP